MLGLNSYNPISDKTNFVGNVIDAYNDVMEKKDNYIAVTIANNTNSTKRAGAAAIGAGSGLLTTMLNFGLYRLLKKRPKLNNEILDRFIVKKFDKWMDRGERIFKPSTKIGRVSGGLAVKIIDTVITGAIIGYLFGVYHTMKNTRLNGRISHTRPGAQGDWVAKGLHTLSKTPEGSSIIKNSIVKNADKSYTIRFDGINKEYNITKKELEEASKTYLTETKEDGKAKGFRRKFSKGDGDVLAFELAVDKYCKEIHSGTLQHNPNVPIGIYMVGEEGDIVSFGGSESGLYYLLTGSTNPAELYKM